MWNVKESEEQSLRPLHTKLSSHAAHTRRARQCQGFGQGPRVVLAYAIRVVPCALKAVPATQRQAIRLDCTEVEIELLVLGQISDTRTQQVSEFARAKIISQLPLLL